MSSGANSNKSSWQRANFGPVRRFSETPRQGRHVVIRSLAESGSSRVIPVDGPV
jgi:hypothetical protein